ncbi:MAG: T9SS type A sorting domain-containing protein [Bacteroidetes bacterium]|nr:T9SS type A sorting domain-containing protein [Bacteroidota bacterium]
MRNFYFLIVFLFGIQISNAQIIGSDTTCAGYIYQYDFTYPGAASYTWTVPNGWYILSGQGTGSVQLYCNVSAGNICVDALDSSLNIINNDCKPVTLGGGGSGWYVDLTPAGPCICSPNFLVIVPNGTGGNCGGCGNGTPSASSYYAAYDNPWPTGNYLGPIGPGGVTIGGPFGGTYYVYYIDTILGFSNAFVVDGGACGGSVNNAITVFPCFPPMVPLLQSPASICPGDTFTVYVDPSLLIFWASSLWNPSGNNISVINTYTDSIQCILLYNQPGSGIQAFFSDIYQCPYGAIIALNIATNCSPNDPCLIAAYPLDGNAIDTTINGNNATFNNTQLATNRFNIANTAAQFNGINNRIDLPDDFDFPQRTWAFWFYADTITTNYHEIFDDDNVYIQNAQTEVFLHDDSTGVKKLYAAIGLNQYIIPVNEKQWYHLALVRDTGETRFYLNGCLMQTSTNMANDHSFDGAISVSLGCHRFHNGNYFKGKLDDLFIYQCALTDSEIAMVADTNCFVATPVAALQSSDTIWCDKKCIDFIDLSQFNPTIWQWTFAGASPSTSTDQNPTGICYNNYGTFDVTLVACNNGGCDTVTYLNFITEYQLPPQPTISFVNDTLFCSQANSYQWFLIPNPIPGAVLQYYYPMVNGSYYVVISDSNGCGNASNTFIISGTIENNSNYFQNFYCDEDGLCTIENLLQNGKVALSIFDLDGRKLNEKIISAQTETVDLKFLPKGIYIVQLMSEKKLYNFKIVR